MKYLDSFLLARKADGVSPNTIIWHEQSMKTLSKWLAANNISNDPGDWTTDDLRRYLVFLQVDSGLSPKSVRVKTQSLFAFTRWLYEEELTESDVRGRLKLPKLPKVVKSAFSDDELRRMIEACKTKRDRAILVLMIDCGCRASEVCDMLRANVNTSQQLIIVEGKGSKQRVIPYSIHSAKILNRYLVELEKSGNTSPYLFPSRRAEKLSPGSLGAVLERIAKRANVEGACLHRIRRTFATSFVRNGGDVFALQKLMGHEELRTTKVYVDLVTEDLQRAHLQASPMTSLVKRRGK